MSTQTKNALTGETSDWVVTDWINQKVRTGFSPIVLVVGKMRSGKTFLAMWMAWLLDKQFSIRNQMFFEVESFAHAINKYKQKVLILDECGVELDSYRYSDVRNRVFSHLIQSQAFRNNIIFLVLPHPSDLGRSHRKYIDLLIHNVYRGYAKFYAPYTFYHDLNELDINSTLITKTTGIPMPPKHLVDEYVDQFETQVKQGILDGEIAKLQLSKSKGGGSSKAQKGIGATPPPTG